MSGTQETPSIAMDLDPKGVPLSPVDLEQWGQVERVKDTDGSAPTSESIEKAIAEGQNRWTAATSKGLISSTTLWGQPTYYTAHFKNQYDTGPIHRFEYDQNFYNQCAVWLNFWYQNNPWITPLWIVSFGVYVAGSRTHYNGRAFDLSRIYALRVYSDGSVARSQVVDADWREWGRNPSPSSPWYAKLYWGTVASLAFFFDTVITYAQDDSIYDEHQNHIHFDITENNSGTGTWHGSKSQITNLQYMLLHCWGFRSVSGTHIYDNATKAAATAVMGYIGRPGRLPTASKSDWLHFNHATWRQASGVTVYH